MQLVACHLAYQVCMIANSYNHSKEDIIIKLSGILKEPWIIWTCEICEEKNIMMPSIKDKLCYIKLAASEAYICKNMANNI
jgi:hypothetical protein